MSVVDFKEKSGFIKAIQIADLNKNPEKPRDIHRNVIYFNPQFVSVITALQMQAGYEDLVWSIISIGGKEYCIEENALDLYERISPFIGKHLEMSHDD